MTKMRFKRHIAKVNLPLLLHHNQSISRLNKKDGWYRRNVGNFCKLEGRTNKRRIILKTVSFHCISNRQGGGGGLTSEPLLPLAYATVCNADIAAVPMALNTSFFFSRNNNFLHSCRSLGAVTGAPNQLGV